MTVHREIINNLKEEFTKDPNVESMFVIGSVARNTYTDKSDLDILLVLKDFQEEQHTNSKTINGVKVETQRNTLNNYLQWLSERPFRIYTFEDIEVIFDLNNNLVMLKEKAEEIKKNFKPDNEEHLKAWMGSVILKLDSAREKGDTKMVGYQLSNVLGKILQAIYNINNLPTPPSTQAFEKITGLAKLPSNFEPYWSDILVGDLEHREKATRELIRFCLDNS